jgi:hypothetical protein
MVPGMVLLLEERSERQRRLDIFSRNHHHLRLPHSLSILPIHLLSLLAHSGIRCNNLSMTANGVA